MHSEIYENPSETGKYIVPWLWSLKILSCEKTEKNTEIENWTPSLEIEMFNQWFTEKKMQGGKKEAEVWPKYPWVT